VYPRAVILVRQADLPRRFIPAAIAFGSVTFTMTSAGSPEIQNLIPIKFLVDSQSGKSLTDARAGWPVSLIVATVMFALGQWYLESAIRRDRRTGARFEPRAGDPPLENPAASLARGPSLIASLFPLAVTLLALNALPFWLPRLGELLAGPARQFPPLGPLARLLLAFPEEPTLAIFAGVVAATCSLWRHIPSIGHALGEGFVNGLLAIGATASVVGFGSAFKGLPAFEQLVQWLTHLPMDPLIGAALAVAVIAGLAGSASGGQGLALPLIKPIYVDQLGVAPRALHRVVAIASGSLDTMPANGYLVMLIRNICGETHKQAYWPVCVTCTLIPLGGTALAILLFKLVPAWGTM
jgi:H+/gluconate symporter-like permease